jgi:iron complex outermembrane receptor protein
MNSFFAPEPTGRARRVVCLRKGPAPRLGALAAAMLLALGAGGAAQAQAPAGNQGPQGDQAGDQAARSQGGQLEEIVVTARFRTESLQETPLAVSAFTSADLEQRSLTNVDQIGAVVPNVYIRPGGVAPTIGIRGVIATDFIYATEPAVGVYIDDVYFGTLAASAFDLVDVDRVEVLRGPQGTLFGKNSLGGAIRVITKKPLGDNTGYLEAAYGNFNTVNIRGAFDIPIIEDKLSLRAVGMSKHRNGYIDRLDFACEMKAEGTPQLAGIGDGIGGATRIGTSPFGTPIYVPVPVTPGSAEDDAFSYPEFQPGARTDGCKIGTDRGIDKQGARVSLRYTPQEKLDVLFTTDYINDDSEAFGDVMKEPRAFPLDPLMVAGQILPALGITDIGAPFDRPEQKYQNFETYCDPIQHKCWPDENSNETWGLANTIDYDIGPNLHMKWVGSYRKYHAVFTTGDDLPLDLTTTYNILDHQQRTAELQFSGNAIDAKLAWTAGAFYYDANSSLGGRVHLQPFNYLGIIPEFDQNDSFHTSNESAFVHGVFDINSKLSVTAGLRYTDEKKEYTFDHTGFLTIAQPAVSSTSRSDWTLGLNYNFADAGMVYGTVATGFRSAGFQPRPWTPGQLQPFPQEEVTSYELGYKGDLVNRRLRLNADVFYMDYNPRVVTTNAAQCTPFDATDPGAPVFGPLGGICPPGTPRAGQNGWNWFAFFSAPGKV